jgi:hypothetical protein
MYEHYDICYIYKYSLGRSVHVTSVKACCATQTFCKFYPSRSKLDSTKVYLLSRSCSPSWCTIRRRFIFCFFHAKVDNSRDPV